MGVVDHGLYGGLGKLAAGHHGDASLGLPDEIGKHRHGIDGGTAAAGGENAVHADFHQILERLREITGHIEGAMAGDLERVRHFQQFSHAHLVDGAVKVENAEDHAACAELFGNQDVALHDGEFVRVVAEISAARTDHHLQPNFDALAYRGNHACAG